ncbi:MAG: SpoIIE family protein phosphatase [Planctomycetes bacterium]|nr:SpoIIE family protein phosphatase [Planctomycetota bacterium]
MDGTPGDLLNDLQTIMAVSRAMGSERDLDRLLALIMRSVTDLVHADRASLFLVDAERSELWTRIAHGAKEIRLPIGSGIAGAVATSGQPVNIPAAYDDARFNAENDQRTGYRTRSILCMPLITHTNSVVGVIQVLNKLTGDHFTAYDEQILSALCSQAGVAIDNAQLILKDLERQRLARDMELARQIQLSLLPQQPPVMAGWRFATYARSCDQTGGDYFDFMPCGDGGVDAVIGDVSGHGLAAAMVMSTARATLRALHSAVPDAGVLVTRLNHLLEQDLSDETFMTLALARLGGDGSCAYVSAGHEPPLVHRTGGRFDVIDDTEIVLGIMGDSVYRTHAIAPLARGDILVLFTDGIFEAQAPPAFEQYGMDRLRAAIGRTSSLGAQAVCDAVVAEVTSHLGGSSPHDDMTIVVAERL